MTTAREMVNRKTGEIIPDTRPEALMITPEYVETQKRSLALLQAMVRDVLVGGRDYGHVPGLPGDFLWDPGASQIIGSFNCYVGERRIKSMVDDGNKIAIVIEVPIISFNSGREVGSGIGASSTYETKHKYRWMENPKEWGYDEGAIKTLKHKTEDGKTKYRIPNPEHGELLNTIIKIASKRAECDAAEGLPGVASALRELFTGRGGAPKRKDPDWATFYAQARQMGLTDDEIHEGLGVSSNLEWISQGKTVNDARIKLADWLAKRGKKTSQASQRSAEEHHLDEDGAELEDVIARSQAAENVQTQGEKSSEKVAPAAGKLYIDLLWLSEYLSKAKWTEATAISWLKRFKVDTSGTLTDVLTRCSHEVQDKFVKEVQDRASMA